MPTVTINSTEYEVMATIAAHDTFLVADITRAAAWDAATAANKDLAAVAVFRFFETLNWIGDADATTTPWPRTIDGLSQTPSAVLSAAYTLAADVEAKPALLTTFAASRAKGSINKVEAGPAKVSFDSPSADDLAIAGPQTRPVPDAIWTMIKPWITTGTSVNAAAFVSGAEADVPSERNYDLV